MENAERTETHACDSISRQAAIDVVKNTDVMVAFTDGISAEDAADLAIRATKASVIDSIEDMVAKDTNVPNNDCISRRAVLAALTDISYNHCKTEGEAIVIDTAKTLVTVMPSAQGKQRYTEEELRVFAHGISLSLLPKRSAQHWRYDEDTATEIKFLERLYEKVVADMRGEQDGQFNKQTGGD